MGKPVLLNNQSYSSLDTGVGGSGATSPQAIGGNGHVISVIKKEPAGRVLSSFSSLKTYSSFKKNRYRLSKIFSPGSLGIKNIIKSKQVNSCPLVQVRSDVGFKPRSLVSPGGIRLDDKIDSQVYRDVCHRGLVIGSKEKNKNFIEDQISNDRKIKFFRCV